ncbi:hypothetical protein D3C84_368600 [compost metagenome]
MIHSALNPCQPADKASIMAWSAEMPTAAHLTSSAFNESHTVWVVAARLVLRKASQSTSNCSAIAFGLLASIWVLPNGAFRSALAGGAISAWGEVISTVGRVTRGSFFV